eukprot:7179559-Prymnesium_polylepis.1
MRRLRCGLWVLRRETHKPNEVEEAAQVPNEVEEAVACDASASDDDDAATILYGVEPTKLADAGKLRHEQRPHSLSSSSRGRRLRPTSLDWLDPWLDLARTGRKTEKVKAAQPFGVSGTCAVPRS